MLLKKATPEPHGVQGRPFTMKIASPSNTSEVFSGLALLWTHTD